MMNLLIAIPIGLIIAAALRGFCAMAIAPAPFGTWIIKGFTGIFDEEPSWVSEPVNSKAEMDITILATPESLQAFELERIA